MECHPVMRYYMPDRKELELLAVRELNKACEKFLGEPNRCKLPMEKYEKGEIDFTEYIVEMEEVFSVLEPVKPEKLEVVIHQRNEESEEEKKV